MKRKKAWWLFVIFCLALLSVPACQKREEKKGDVYKIFYVNHDNTSVLYYEYTTESKAALSWYPTILRTGSLRWILTRNTEIRK